MKAAFPLPVLGLAIEQAFNAVLVVDAGDVARGPRVVYANPRFSSLSGYRLDEVLGRSPILLLAPHVAPQVIRQMHACLKEGEVFQGTTLNYRKGGKRHHLEWTITPVRDEQAATAYFIAVLQDVSARIEAQAQRDLMASALSATAACVLIADLQGRIVFVNQAMAAQTGYSPSELLGRSPGILKSGEHNPAFYAGMWQQLKAGQTFRATFTNRRKDGSIYHCEQTISPGRDADGRFSHYISVSKDVSERVDAESSLREQVSRDALTGLYNRRFAEPRLQLCCIEASEQNRPLSLMLCDIDHFKSINDTFGHAAGDIALQVCSQAILRGLRQTDIAVRWGGEEFLVIVPDCNAEAALALAERIRECVCAEQISVARPVTVSIGVAQVSAQESPAQALARADAALLRAKREGRNRVEFAWAG